MSDAGLSEPEKDMVRRLDWIGLVRHGVNFFVLEKFARVAKTPNLVVYASMRGESFEDFMQTQRRLGLGWAKSHSFFNGQTPVMKYKRALMQAILWDRIKIAETIGVEVISLDQAPRGYAEFDAGAPKRFVIDPHGMLA